MSADAPRPFTAETGKGRLDVDGVEWFACDPYPTWYRWVDGELITRRDPQPNLCRRIEDSEWPARWADS